MTSNHNYLCTPTSQTDAEAKSAIEIQLADRSLIDQADDCLKLLAEANSPPTLFICGGKETYLNPGDGSMREVNSTRIKLALSSIAVFVRHGKRQNPPDDVVKAVLELLPEYGLFPQLSSVVNAPSLRPDGTIIEQPGYDTQTRLYYVPDSTLHIPYTPEKPTRVEIKAAVALVEDIICDFPFVDASSKANYIGALLTSVIRSVIKGPTPLALFDAPDKGTGKTLMAEVVSIITTGNPGAMMNAPTREEEWVKTLTSILRQGRPMVIFDNVETRLKSSALDAVLTGEFYTGRLVGLGDVPVLPVRCSWIATLNNVQCDSQIARRTYLARIDAKTPQPTKRTNFRHEHLKIYVADNRGNLMAALFTMARAWFEAGCPKPKVHPLASFEEWTRVIGGILEVCDIRGFLANRDKLTRNADLETQQWHGLLRCLSQASNNEPFTSKKVAELAIDDQDLKDALQSIFGDVANDTGKLKQRLPRQLNEKLDRRFGDEDSQVWIESAGTAQHAIRWKICTSKTIQRTDNVIEMHQAKREDKALSDADVLAEFAALALR